MNYKDLVVWLRANKLNGFRFAMDDAIMSEASNLRIGVIHDTRDFVDPEMLDHVGAIEHCRDIFITQFISEIIQLAHDPQPTFVVEARDVLVYTSKSIARALAWEYFKRK